MAKLPRHLIGFSKDLRKRQTPEEEILWSHLRANKFGIKFKRQVVLEDYIYDFGAKKYKILIELDGARHKKSQSNNDKDKTKCALKHNYTLLKFWNSEINTKLDGILEKIFNQIN